MDKNEFFTAIKQGQVETVRQALVQDPALSAACTDQGLSVVLLAAYYGQQQIAVLLAEHRSDLNIFEAATVGNLEQVKHLLESDPGQVNAYAGDGFFPLGLACFFGQPAVAAFLVQNGADVHQRSRNPAQVMSIHAAAASQNLESARLLLEHGADPNARQADEFLPLHSAAQNGQLEMARLLVQFGANPSLANGKGITPQAMAEQEGHKDVAEYLKGLAAGGR